MALFTETSEYYLNFTVFQYFLSMIFHSFFKFRLKEHKHASCNYISSMWRIFCKNRTQTTAKDDLEKFCLKFNGVPHWRNLDPYIWTSDYCWWEIYIYNWYYLRQGHYVPCLFDHLLNMWHKYNPWGDVCVKYHFQVKRSHLKVSLVIVYPLRVRSGTQLVTEIWRLTSWILLLDPS